MFAWQAFLGLVDVLADAFRSLPERSAPWR